LLQSIDVKHCTHTCLSDMELGHILWPKWPIDPTTQWPSSMSAAYHQTLCV